MAVIFAVNPRNDIFATPGNRLALARGLPAVLQQCEHLVKARLGEMQYAADRGVAYLDNVFSGNPNLLLFEAQVRAAITRSPNVISVSAFTVDIVDNTLVYSAEIQTNLGTGIINGNV